MVGMGEHDELENRYTPRFEVLLSESGVVLEYKHDRAGIDTGLHLFARGEKTTAKGERPYWRPLASRVWFQLKGKHESTFSAADFDKATHVSVQVSVEHLRYWYAAPEPVYLVVWIESVDKFIGMDVRDLVDERWGERFYSELRDVSGDITVVIPTDAVMDGDRIANLVNHRSMRIDGPTFRGRPLGHRIDPLRSVLATPSSDVWAGMVEGLLAAHDFVELARTEVEELVVLHGTIAQTLLWQSPAFAEYGLTRGDDYREEPRPEQLFGHVCVIRDTAEGRTHFTSDELAAVTAYADAAGDSGLALAVIFPSRDLSATGGLWRSTLNGTAAANHHEGWRQIGLEALSYLVLVSTLVYLDYAADLEWDHANYLS